MKHILLWLLAFACILQVSLANWKCKRDRGGWKKPSKHYGCGYYGGGSKGVSYGGGKAICKGSRNVGGWGNGYSKGGWSKGCGKGGRNMGGHGWNQGSNHGGGWNNGKSGGGGWNNGNSGGGGSNNGNNGGGGWNNGRDHIDESRNWWKS